MTPKEKAFHLHWKFVREIIADKDKAKQCALIAVNEILTILWHTHKNESEYRYWKEVKQEIEKL